MAKITSWVQPRPQHLAGSVGWTREKRGDRLDEENLWRKKFGSPKKTLDCFIIGKSLHRYWNWLKEGWSELSQYQTILSLLVSTTNKSTLRYLRSLLAALLLCVPRRNQASRSKSMGDQFSDSGTNTQWEIESRSVSKTLAHSCYFHLFSMVPPEQQGVSKEVPTRKPSEPATSSDNLEHLSSKMKCSYYSNWFVDMRHLYFNSRNNALIDVKMKRIYFEFLGHCAGE